MATVIDSLGSNGAGSNGRVVEVLNFLAAHPTEAFTLSELAGHLGLSNGSAHRVLTALSDARFLTRHLKHKTYSLGVALVAVGQAALEKHRGLDVARREMARLTGEIRGQCIASAVVDDELLLLAKEGLPQTHDVVMRVGERRPYVPPVGLGKVAWCDEREVEDYFAKAPAAMPAPVRQRMRQSLELIRQRGYAMASIGDVLRNFSQAAVLPIGQRRDSTYWERVNGLLARLTPNECQLIDIAEAARTGIGHISAQVFAPNGAVVFELTLSGMPTGMSVEEIEHYANRLRAAAAIVTAETHGRAPR